MVSKKSSYNELKITIADSQKTMPYAADVEKSLLATMISDPKCINTVVENFSDESVFYSEANQKIFTMIREFTIDNNPVDLNLPILMDKLRANGWLDDVGGVQYLVELTNYAVSSEQVESLTKVLIEKHILREIIKHSLYIAHKGYDSSTDVFELLNEAEAGLFRISEKKFIKTYHSLSALLPKVEVSIQKMRKSEVPGIPTGYQRFNQLTGGFQNSDLIIIAARPGVGKTAFGLSLAYNIAKQEKLGIGFFSLEMKAEQIVIRLLSQESRIDTSRLRIGRYRDQETQKLAIAIRVIQKLPIYIDDTPAITLYELRAKARRMILEHNVKIIFVDYLQLMQGPENSESREREISYISRGLKALAKELDIPIVALAQLNRQVETRQTKIPMLSDLRESGAIEQDADIVCFLHRKDLYKSSQDGEEHDEHSPKLVDVIIAKQRNGPTGEFQLVFLPSFTRFEDKVTHEFYEQVQQNFTPGNDNLDSDFYPPDELPEEPPPF